MKRSLLIVALIYTLTGCQTSNPPEAIARSPQANPSTPINSPVSSQAPTPQTNPSTATNFPVSSQQLATVPSSQTCNISAYVIDQDPQGLNVRINASSSSKIITKLPTNTDAAFVDIVASQDNWVQIIKAESTPQKVEFQGKGWVYTQLLGTSTRGYGTKGVNVYQEASEKSKVVGRIPDQKEVKLLSCRGSYAKIQYENITGWLAREAQCPNPLTTCP